MQSKEVNVIWSQGYRGDKKLTKNSLLNEYPDGCTAINVLDSVKKERSSKDGRCIPTFLIIGHYTHD